MKFMIRCDVEGATGVTTYEQAYGGGFGKAMLSNDVNAAIAGVLATGNHEIVLYDEHTDGLNVPLEDLPENVVSIRGKPPYRPDWGGIDSSYDAMMMVGFHARSGAPGGLLPHSYSRKHLNIRINGRLVGEIGVEAAIAGDFDVPSWLVTGDSVAMAEAQELLPGVRTVVVKEAMGESAAGCYTPKLTSRRIREAAKSVVESPPEVKPLKFEAPVVLQIDLAESEYLDALRSRYSELVKGSNTVELEGNTVTEVWSRYCRVQAEVRS
jgi:D-amino peptidase